MIYFHGLGFHKILFDSNRFINELLLKVSVASLYLFKLFQHIYLKFNFRILYIINFYLIMLCLVWWYYYWLSLSFPICFGLQAGTQSIFFFLLYVLNIVMLNHFEREMFWEGILFVYKFLCLFDCSFMLISLFAVASSCPSWFFVYQKFLLLL